MAGEAWPPLYVKNVKEYLPELLDKPGAFPPPTTLLDLIEEVVVLAEEVTPLTMAATYIYVQRLPIVQQASFWTLVIRRNQGDLTYSPELKNWLQNNRHLFPKTT